MLLRGALPTCSFGVVLLEIVTGIMPVTRGQTAQPVVPDDCPEVCKQRRMFSLQVSLQPCHHLSMLQQQQQQPASTYLSIRQAGAACVAR